MSTESKFGQRRVSDVAKELAGKNAHVIQKIATESSPQMRQALSEFREVETNELLLSKGILNAMTTKNAERIDAQSRSMLSDARTLADEIDVAANGLEKMLRRWTEVAGQAVSELRTKRMAINAEIAETARSVKDATAFLSDLNKGDAFATLAKFAEVGATLKAAYGDVGLVRLADALLVLSEVKPS